MYTCNTLTTAGLARAGGGALTLQPPILTLCTPFLKLYTQNPALQPREFAICARIHTPETPPPDPQPYITFAGVAGAGGGALSPPLHGEPRPLVKRVAQTERGRHGRGRSGFRGGSGFGLRSATSGAVVSCGGVCFWGGGGGGGMGGGAVVGCWAGCAGTSLSLSLLLSGLELSATTVYVP